MKKSSSQTTKVKAKVAPALMESDGDWLRGNIWFKIGLTKKPVSLIFWQEDELVESHGIDLEDAEFAAIQKDATAHGESLDAWLCRTINESAALRNLKLEVAS